MKKILLVGLGNKGEEYKYTRHNIGFLVVDALAEKYGASFTSTNFGWQAEFNLKGKKFILAKPDTYMNLSGNAVKYWLNSDKIPIEQLLVITDDLHLPYGTIRMKPKGSDAGHNGLKSIQEQLNTSQYPRIRFGIGNGFHQGGQVDYVLGKWSIEEMEELPRLINITGDAAIQFGLAGIGYTMNKWNGNHLENEE